MHSFLQRLVLLCSSQPMQIANGAHQPTSIVSTPALKGLTASTAETLVSNGVESGLRPWENCVAAVKIHGSKG